MADPPEIVPEIPRKPQIEVENRATVARVRDMALSPRLRQAYRPAGVWTPRAVAAFPEGRTRRLEIDGRRLVLRERAPASLLRRLRVAEDMHAFTRSAEREAALLRLIAARPEANLTVAHTPEGEIVAEASLAPAEGRWADMDNVYELAVQVAPSWRRAGLGEMLIRYVTEPDYVESLILIALGVSWHWDLEGTALNPYAYRDVLVRTFGAGGFRPYATDDPDIAAGEGNVLLARIGRHISSEMDEEFDRRLNRRRAWLGF
jgi:GNAT superfamily N-acetyltransferase